MMNKILMIVGMAFIGFVIVLGVSIGNRLDQQTVTLLMGSTCGVGVALPIGIIVGIYLGDRRRHEPQSPPQPIVIMQPPQQPPASINAPLLQAPYVAPQPRSFNIIGDDSNEAS
jgi:hypothetical protein